VPVALPAYLSVHIIINTLSDELSFTRPESSVSVMEPFHTPPPSGADPFSKKKGGLPLPKAAGEERDLRQDAAPYKFVE
jgi:hypothetical protein